MLALATQFDDRRLASAVATPTCSSCCCCCCCLATSIATSSLLAQRISKEGKRQNIPNRGLLTFLAALFIPLVAAIEYFGAWFINGLFSRCTTRVIEPILGQSGDSYRVCTNAGSTVALPLIVLGPVLILWFLYSRVKIEHPIKRAILVTALFFLAFVLEVAAGAPLILTGVGGIVYLIMVPVIVGWITVWYHRHLGREADLAIAGTPYTPASLLTAEQTQSEPHEDHPTEPAPPAASRQ